MAMLAEGQFSLDGYIFGTPADDVVVLEKGWDTSGLEFRVQDVDLPLGDSTLFGRDYLSTPTWTFILGVRHATDVYTTLEKLITAWRHDPIRSMPGSRSELHYVRNGQARMVYGRPRTLNVEPDEIADPTFKLVTAQFKLAEVVSHGSDLHVVSISQVTTTPGTGLVLPATLPWTLEGSTGARAGIVQMASAIPAPFEVELIGPDIGEATDIRVWSADWALHFGVTLRPGDVLTYDTATGTATLNGNPASAALQGSSTARPRMTPGSNEIILTSSDTSNTVRAAIRWRDVFASF